MSMRRRVFLRVSAATGAMVAMATQAQGQGQGQGQAMVGEKEPQAAALGYVDEAARVDKKKFPKYAPGQLCSNCTLYQGKPTDPVAGCAIFGGRKVAGPGWCSAWVKKA